MGVGETNEIWKRWIIIFQYQHPVFTHTQNPKLSFQLNFNLNLFLWLLSTVSLFLTFPKVQEMKKKKLHMTNSRERLIPGHTGLVICNKMQSSSGQQSIADLADAHAAGNLEILEIPSYFTTVINALQIKVAFFLCRTGVPEEH